MNSGNLKYLVLLFLGFWGGISGAVAHGQDPFSGFQPLHALATNTDVDTVNISTGDLLIHIPYLSFPQKGKMAPLTFSLGYQRMFWDVDCEQSDPLGDQTCFVLPLSGGYMYSAVTPALSVMQDTSCEITGTSGCTFYAVDGSLAEHRLVYTSATDPSQLESEDATGIHFDFGAQTVTESNGARYGRVISTTGTEQVLAYPETPDGNVIALHLPNGTGNPNSCASYLIDTYGRNIPLEQCPSSAISNLTTTLHYPGYAGADYPVGYQYTVLPYGSNFSGTIDPSFRDFSGQMAFLTSLTTPAGTYSFSYNSWGDLAQITLPQGGTISYTWTTSNNPFGAGFWRTVTSRTTDAQDGTGPHVTTYDRSQTNSCGGAVESNEDGDIVYHVGFLNTSYFVPYVELERQYFSGRCTNGTKLKTVDTTYTADTGSGVDSPVGYRNLALSTKQTIYPNGFWAKKTYTYDDGAGLIQYFRDNPETVDSVAGQRIIYGSLLSVNETDSNSSATSGITRTTNTSYTWQNPQSPYRAANILNLPCLETIYSAGAVPIQSSCSLPAAQSNQQSQTVYGYDENNGSPQGVHGNLTSQTRWLNTGGSIVTSSIYNDGGTPQKTIDANGHSTSITYQCSGALPYQITNPLNQTTTYGYDCNTGRLTSVQSPNDAANSRAGTTYAYTLPGDLLTANFPDGGRVSFDYHGYAMPLHVTATRIAAPNPSLLNDRFYDGFNRPVKSVLPSGAQVDMGYDWKGRLTSQSNPYSAAGEASDGTVHFQYDPLDQRTGILFPDGASKSSTYSSNVITTKDEAGHQHVNTYDGLSRLSQVTEEGGMTTTYGYDALDNLTTVSQPGRPVRSFSYDSVGRLLTASNPETGTVCYGSWSNGNCINGYDANGNLLAKTDARGVTMNYVYDSLNRLTKKFTANELAVPLYVYDTNNITFSATQRYTTNNVIGRLSVICVDVPGACQSMTAFSYDAMGRVQQSFTSTPSNPSTGAVYSTSAQYDLAGNMTSLTYPDGRTITQGWNSAGQLQSVTYDNWNGQHIGYPYISATAYWPSGALRALLYGNNMASGYHMNNREQIDETSHLQLSTNARYSEKLYCFGVATSPIDSISPPCDAIAGGNNGNVYQIKDVVNPNNLQSFSYDSLDRLMGASIPNHLQQYGYDSVGNMSILSGGTFAATFDPSTNRISNLPCASATTPYDASGNQLCDTDSNGGVRRYTWDAEGRVSQITSFGTTSPFVSYLYDGNGQRIQKNKADGSFTEYLQFNGQTIAERNSDNSWNDYIFADGQRIARADTAINPLDPQASTTFYHFGRLGSTEATTDGNGNLLSLSDYLPFGQEVTTSASSNHYKFTGKERDSESGNDYFGARYYISNMGRWISPDYSMNSVILELPQSWNKYNYVLNRPLFASDPDGRCPWCVGAIVGGVIEGGVDAYNQLSAPGGNIHTFNYGEFGAHVVGGALSGALAVATGGTTLVESAVVGDVAAGGVSNVVGGAVTRALDPTVKSDDVLSAGAIAEDAVSGFVGGYAGHLAGDSIHLPDEPVNSGVVSARRRLPARTPDGRFASYDKLARQQITRAGVSGGAFTHIANWFNDLFFPPTVEASPRNTRVTVTIVSCTTQDGQSCSQ